jgi:hypothetical protein
MTTMWRPVKGFPDYEISNDGRARRVTGGMGATPGRELKPIVSHNGYHRFALVRGGKVKVRQAHRLVAQAFIGDPPFKGALVLHWDGNPVNNRVENLRWGTQKENCADRDRHGRTCRGVRHSRQAAKLTAKQVVETKAASGLQREIAERYGIRQSQVSRIKSGVRWAHV